MQIKDLKPSQIPEATAFLLKQYQNLRFQLPWLPDHASQPELIEKKLLKYAQEYPTAAAFENGTLVGYMSGFPLDDLKGKCKSVYTPEWAHAALPQSAPLIYEALYSGVSRAWVAAGWFQQGVTVFKNQPEIEDFFYTHGFGLHIEDGVRSMDPILPRPQTAGIRPVEVNEAGLLTQLEEEYGAYMAEPTSFMQFQAKTVDECAQWLSLPFSRAWFALEDGKPCGYLVMEQGAPTQSFVLRDEKTFSICGAYIRPGVRGKGLMTAMLDQGLRWYTEKGFKMCVVDFETQNDLARRFWRKYFHCVTRSLIRRVDERINDPR